MTKNILLLFILSLHWCGAMETRNSLLEENPSKKSINEESPSLSIIKSFFSHMDEGPRKAMELFEDPDISSTQVAKSWRKDLPVNVAFYAAFTRKPESIERYRNIIIQEPRGLHSYHGYDCLSAGNYDVFTTVGEVLWNCAVEPRSRFRFDSIHPPYESIDTFLEEVHFLNDHSSEFSRHGTSAVPHLFSNTAELAENCLTGFHAPYIQTSPEQVDLMIKELGLQDSEKYIKLMTSHLKGDSQGGFLTRFTFMSKDALNLATYPAPNATATRQYGKPWISDITGERYLSSEFYDQILRLGEIADIETKELLFNMQYRNIFIPRVYNDAALVQTKVFSFHDLPTLDEYYQTLKGYVKEDMKSWDHRQLMQAHLWLK